MTGSWKKNFNSHFRAPSLLLHRRQLFQVHRSSIKNKIDKILFRVSDSATLDKDIDEYIHIGSRSLNCVGWICSRLREKDVWALELCKKAVFVTKRLFWLVRWSLAPPWSPPRGPDFSGRPLARFQTVRWLVVEQNFEPNRPFEPSRILHMGIEVK